MNVNKSLSVGIAFKTNANRIFRRENYKRPADQYPMVSVHSCTRRSFSLVNILNNRHKIRNNNPQENVHRNRVVSNAQVRLSIANANEFY